MTTINPNGKANSAQPLEIKEGMTVGEVQKKGTDAQKAAATRFDVNGDGKYDYYEAYDFSHTKIKSGNNGTEIHLYDEDGNLQKKVDINAEKQDYANRTAKRQKFEQTLTTYGIDIDNAEWVGINECSTKTINGKTYLILKATPTSPAPDKNSTYTIEDSYELSIPIDKDFDPSKIKMYRAEDEANVHFENVNGTLKILGEETRNHGFAFGGNSNITVIGKDGVADLIAAEGNAKVSVKTGDYADTLEDRTKGDDIRLKPGTTTVQANEND